MSAPASPALARPAASTAMPILLALSASHFLNDLIQSLLPSVYPILKDRLALTYAQVGLITFVFQGTASSHFTATNCVISNISGAAAIPGTTETFLRNTIVVNTPGTWPALTTASHCIVPAVMAGSNNII